MMTVCNTAFFRKSILLVAFLSLFSSVSARIQNDTINTESNFRWQQVVLPVSLIGAGALGFVEPVKTGRVKLRNSLNNWRGSHRVSADDYLEYAPMVSVYAMSLCGAKAKHNYIDRTLEMAISYLSLATLVNGVKHIVHMPRPDGSSNNSFPSGHTSTAFMGAELVRIEYGESSPWYPAVAYTVATAVGALRVYNDRHWITDVVAGAGVGILSARIGYWMLPYTKKAMHWITGWEGFIMPSVSRYGTSLDVAIRF